MNDKNKPSKLPAVALLAALGGNIPNALVAATPGGIERQEAQGQKDLVAGDLLPLEGIEEVAKALGITYDKNPVDGIFIKAKMPGGWTKKASPDHAMWSYIFDESGKKRASIFYKAAFYDRRAFIRLEVA